MANERSTTQTCLKQSITNITSRFVCKSCGQKYLNSQQMDSWGHRQKFGTFSFLR